MDHFRSKLHPLMATAGVLASLFILPSACASTSNSASDPQTANAKSQRKLLGQRCEDNADCGADQCLNGVCSQSLEQPAECAIDYDCDCQHQCFGKRCMMISGAPRC